jgi:ABC-type multidrug transport system fused ATPase/permease subunit
MDLALTASIEDFPRDAKRKNLVLVTDGMPNDFEKTCEAAKLVKKKGIGLYYILVMEQYQDLENLEKLVDDCGKGKIIAIKARDFGNWLQLAFGNYFYFLVVLLITMLTVYASYHQARFLSHLLPIYLPGAIPLTVVSKVSFSFWIVFTLVILVGLFHIIGWKLGTILIAVSMVVIVVIGLFTNRF